MFEHAKWIENAGCPAEWAPIFRKTIELEEDEEGEYTITTYTTIEITKDAKIISLKERSEIELDFECDQQTWEDEFEYLVSFHNLLHVLN